MSRPSGISGTGPQPSQRVGATDLRDQFRSARDRIAEAPIEVNQARARSAGQEAAERTGARAGERTSIETIGRRLAELRKQSGITQIKVANVTGSTQPSVARFESDANQPNLRTVERYAQSIEARISVELEAAEGTVDTVPLGEAVERLSGLRREAGVSQTVVAKRMEATQPAVARIERGEPAPNLKTIERYANAIGFGLNLRVDLNK